MSPEPVLATPDGAESDRALIAPRFRLLRRLMFVFAALAGAWILSLFMHTASASAATTPVAPTAPVAPAASLTPVVASVQNLVAAVPTATEAVASEVATTGQHLSQTTHQLAPASASVPVVGRVVAAVVPVVDRTTTALDATIDQPTTALNATVAQLDTTSAATLDDGTTTLAPTTGAQPLSTVHPADAMSINGPTAVAAAAPTAVPNTPVAPAAPVTPVSPSAPSTTAANSFEFAAITAPFSTPRRTPYVTIIGNRDQVVAPLITDDPTFAPD